MHSLITNMTDFNFLLIFLFRFLYVCPDEPHGFYEEHAKYKQSIAFCL